MASESSNRRFFKATLWISDKEGIIFDNPSLLNKWKRIHPRAVVEYPPAPKPKKEEAGLDKKQIS
jgi:hypothetical protein